jgi:hypothetical protein
LIGCLVRKINAYRKEEKVMKHKTKHKEENNFKEGTRTRRCLTKEKERRIDNKLRKAGDKKKVSSNGAAMVHHFGGGGRGGLKASF